MSEKKILSTVTKTLLKNVIRHTDSHNKVVEESEMWRQREKERSGSSSDYSFLKDRRSDMRYEFPSPRDRRAHMDDEPESRFWMRELYKAEEADKNRWGHSGYKELYPEHFSSTDSSSSEESPHRKMERRHKKRKRSTYRKSRKRKHSESSNTDSEAESRRKHKKRHKHKDKIKSKKSKHKKKRHRQDSSSSSGS